MNIDNFYSSFHKKYEEEFDEYLNEVRTYLENNNNKYINLKKKFERLIDTSESIQNIICNDYISKPLSIDESKKLAKIISIYIDMQSIVEKEIYFKGGADTYDYFKRIRVIK